MTPRVAIYARYSTDRQSDSSITDQVAVCEDYAEAKGWKVARSYFDSAISGADCHRPDFQRLLADLKSGTFDIVLAESIDRLSRDQEDIHHLYKRIDYHGIKLYTCADGLNSTIHVGLKGIIAAQYLEDIAQKTRRGLAGRVRLGRSAGGRCYGYDVVREVRDDGTLTTGERRLNPYEAEIVRRIFKDYVNGFSTKSIAKQLNREGVPSPRGGKWNASTVVGNQKRGNGILNNKLYIGRLVWNRQKFKKDPDTRRRQAIPNPESEWLTKHVPELRIVSDAMWDKAKSAQKERRKRAARFGKRSGRFVATRPHHLLSGLLHCRICGGAYVSAGGNRWRCGNHILRGTCENSRSFTKTALEQPVYEALNGVFYGPLVVHRFKEKLKAHARKVTNAAGQGDRERPAKIRDVKARQKRLLSAIESGQQIEPLVRRMAELEEEEKALVGAAGAGNDILELETSAAEKLFGDIRADLAEVISNRPFAHAAKLALRNALTNRHDWWEHGKAEADKTV